MPDTETLENLARALFRAKAAEAQAKEARIAAEEALADAIGGRDSGSTTVQCGSLKATVKRGWNYRLSEPIKFRELFPDYVREKIELRDRNYEEARATRPELFAELSKFVTATPKKVSVELKA